MTKPIAGELVVGSPVLLCGEAFGQAEDLVKAPFQGASGQLLNHLLHAAGLDRAACSVTNVFNIRPPKNEVGYFFGSKKEVADYEDCPPLHNGKRLRPVYLQELARLREEIGRVQPRIIVALGATALWALTGNSKISDHRGTLLKAKGFDVIPTFHPAAVLRDWGMRPIVISDLDRARRHVEHGLKETVRDLRICECEDDLAAMFQHLSQAEVVAADVETAEGQITCISFAPTATCAYVVPLWYPDTRSNAWPEDVEASFYLKLHDLAQSTRLLFHNAVYDLSYLAELGIRPRHVVEDTMLLHHAVQPELRKSLGFMASMYLDQPSWKWMRVKANKDVNKKDE